MVYTCSAFSFHRPSVSAQLSIVQLSFFSLRFQFAVFSFQLPVSWFLCSVFSFQCSAVSVQLSAFCFQFPASFCQISVLSARCSVVSSVLFLASSVKTSDLGFHSSASSAQFHFKFCCWLASWLAGFLAQWRVEGSANALAIHNSLLHGTIYIYIYIYTHTHGIIYYI